MKRIILIALTIMVSASFYTASAQKVTLTTPSDSLSYAAGASMTDGLMTFLKQQYDMDEAYLDDFLSSFEEAMKSGVDGKKKAYSAGIQIAAMVKERMLPSISNDLQGSDYTIQEELFTKGFMASLKKDSTVFGQDPKPYFNTRMGAVVNAKKEAVRKAGEQFLSENSKKAGVQVTPSGLQYKILTKGKGKVPTKDDQVIVKYEGRLIDGTVFDSSYKRAEQTNKFRPTDVIKGWTEALTMMPVGSKWELYVPQELAYGARETGNIPAYSALIFIVELVGIEK
ncbi:MAG: FKBP-type peptidyl-prolyl cis-trans isomerase [Prevotella sp.]|nr:FKBP-type peptidyl-prolyl cis-trans isomerase [Prevotella sp.]